MVYAIKCDRCGVVLTNLKLFETVVDKHYCKSKPDCIEEARMTRRVRTAMRGNMLDAI